MEILHDAPSASFFTSLSVHQSQTPDSFFSGPPVLYHYSPSATLSLHTSDLTSATILSRLAEGGYRPANGISTTVNGGVEEHEIDEEIEIRGVDVWVTSERLLLYSSTQSSGISIPYPSLSLHAIQSQPPSLFLQLLTSTQTFDDHDPDSTVSLTIIPSPASATAPDRASIATSPDRAVDPSQPEQIQSSTQALYTALTSCANLHSDPLSGSNDDEDGDGVDNDNPRPPNSAIRLEGEPNGDVNGIYPLYGRLAEEDGVTALPPPLPGSGGWITAENVGDFFDEDGNWRGGEEWTENETLGVLGGGVANVEVGLGSGAGNVRAREENGTEGDQGDETKWRRTE